ncbi:MAG TPA: alpha/beta fold hydrolase, partial [Rubrivivax sp.]|nr:alpha/beta fold hydrolase [Rubrivivax sp.]
PLLLIMGLGTQMIAWDEAFCAQLAARGLRVIRFDNRDIGRSTWFADAGIPDIGRLLMQALAGAPVDAAGIRYTLADMADDAVGLLDALGIPSAHIVGASMGGAIAQEIALRHPARVRTLVPIMATSGAPGLPPPQPAAMQILLTPTPTERSAYLARYRNVMKVLRAGDFPEEEALDDARGERAFERGVNPAGVARQLAAIIVSGSRRERLPGVRAPTLVIHGDADPLVPIECGRDIARSVPGAGMVTVPGMGHALPRSAWPQIVDAIAGHVR